MPETLTDEILMAYADGELDRAKQREVESVLRDDPALQARLQIFERTGRSLGEAFEDIPTPAATVEPNPEPAKQPWWRGWRLSESISPAYGYGFATAAAMIIAVVVVWQALVMPTTTRQPLVYMDNQQLVAGGALRAALEAERSQGLDVTPADEPVVLQTFRDMSGRYCREYAADGGALHGVACRSGDMHWQVRLHASASADPARPGDYAPAGADTTQLVDGFVHQIMAGEPLPPEAEAKIIAEEWITRPE